MSRIQSSSIVTAAILCCLVVPVQAEQSLKERVSSYVASGKDTAVSLASRASSATKHYASRGAEKASSLVSCAKDKAIVLGGAAKTFAQKPRVKQVAIGGGILLIAGGLGYYFRENISNGFALSRKQVTALLASLGIVGATQASDEQVQTRSIAAEGDVVSEKKLLRDHTLAELSQKARESGQNALSAIGAWAQDLKERAFDASSDVGNGSDSDDSNIPGFEG